MTAPAVSSTTPLPPALHHIESDAVENDNDTTWSEMETHPSFIKCMVTDVMSGKGGFHKCVTKALKASDGNASSPNASWKWSFWDNGDDSGSSVKLVPSDARDAELDNYFRYSLSKTEEVNFIIVMAFFLFSLIIFTVCCCKMMNELFHPSSSGGLDPDHLQDILTEIPNDQQQGARNVVVR